VEQVWRTTGDQRATLLVQVGGGPGQVGPRANDQHIAAARSGRIGHYAPVSNGCGEVVTHVATPSELRSRSYVGALLALAVVLTAGLLTLACSGQEDGLDDVVVACVSSADEVDALMAEALSRFDDAQQRVGQVRVVYSAPGVEAVVAPGSSSSERAALVELMESLPNVVHVVHDVDDCRTGTP
jgi:hypothetical protein